jgi:hypothetical protein
MSSYLELQNYTKLLERRLAKLERQEAAGGGVSDHGGLTGLGDDDHTHYLLATGARVGASSVAQEFTNRITATGGLTAADTIIAGSSITATGVIVAGGSLVGSTAANGDLTINGTSHATTASSILALQSTGGLVGIGTTSPAAELHLRSDGARLQIDSTLANAEPKLIFGNDTNYWSFLVNGLGGEFIIRDLSAGADRMTFDLSGNVGIGAAVPAARLDVNGTGKFGDYALIGTAIPAGFYNDINNGAYRSRWTTASGVTSGFYFQDYSGGITNMYVGLTGAYAGRVGIYNTTPLSRLHVGGAYSDTTTQTATISTAVSAGAVVDGLFLDGYQTGAYTEGLALVMGFKGVGPGYAASRLVNYGNLSVNYGTRLQIQTHNTTQHVWNTGIFISETGIVGINTTTPDPGTQLQIEGLNTSSGSASGFNTADRNNGLSHGYTFYSASNIGRIYSTGMGGDVMAFNEAGHVGIGTTSPTSYMSGTNGLSIYSGTFPSVALANPSGHWLMYTVGTNLYLWNSVNSLNRVVFEAGGDVGIGTDVPTEKLCVAGNINAGFGTPNNVYVQYQTNSRMWLSGIGHTDGDDKFIIHDSTVGLSRLVVDTNGLVGIGTSSPSGKVSIVVNDAAAIPGIEITQNDLDQDFIEFKSSVGAGSPIDTAAVGTYYGKIRVAANGTFRYIPLYNT